VEPRYSLNTLCLAVIAVVLILIFLFGVNITNS
jgi:hypothetical protein